MYVCVLGFALLPTINLQNLRIYIYRYLVGSQNTNHNKDEISISIPNYKLEWALVVHYLLFGCDFVLKICYYIYKSFDMVIKSVSLRTDLLKHFFEFS